MNDPEQLVRTILFVVGLHCALHAGGEYRNLCSIGFHSQFRYTFPDGGECHTVYREDLGTKTNKGGLMHKKLKPEVTIYPDPENCECCPVRVIYKYHTLLPINRKCSALYLCPHRVFVEGVWYLDMPIGINKIRGFIKEITSTAGLDGYFMNHSLRLTAATQLYQGGMEEQVITEITGHHSLAV